MASNLSAAGRILDGTASVCDNMWNGVQKDRAEYWWVITDDQYRAVSGVTIMMPDAAKTSAQFLNPGNYIARLYYGDGCVTTYAEQAFTISRDELEDPSIVLPETKKVTLKFNANGGTGAPDDMSQESDEDAFTFNIPTNTPVRTGYVFQGWCTKSSGVGRGLYPAGGKITIGASATLFAIWAEVPPTPSRTVKMTLNPNGGSISGYSNEYTASINTTSTYASFTVPNLTVTRSGYTFQGWSLSGATYSAGNTVKLSNSATLYAVWTENSPPSTLKTFRLTYNLNGKSASGAPSYDSKNTYASSATFTITSSKPTVSGYTFVGWNTKSDGSGKYYYSGNSYTISSNTTL